MALIDIANQIGRYLVTDLPWDAIAQKGGYPRNEAVYHSDFLNGYLFPAVEEADKIISKLDLAWDVPYSQVADAWYGVTRGILSVESQVWAGINSNSLNLSTPLELNVEIWRVFISNLYINMMKTAVLFKNANIHHIVVKELSNVSNANSETARIEIENIANRVNGQALIIKNLYALGLLNPIKKKGLSGLGVAGALTIVGVAVVVAIAWALVTSEKNNKLIDLAQRNCEEAKKLTDTDSKEIAERICYDLVSAENSIKKNKSPLDVIKDNVDSLSKDVGKLILLGGVVYIGVLLLPAVMSTRHYR